jgi:hypothetical protein
MFVLRFLRVLHSSPGVFRDLYRKRYETGEGPKNGEFQRNTIAEKFVSYMLKSTGCAASTDTRSESATSDPKRATARTLKFWKLSKEIGHEVGK